MKAAFDDFADSLLGDLNRVAGQAIVGELGPEIVNLPRRAITGADVIATARGWLSTPWRHQAAVKGVGTDCIGLIGGVALELGLPGAVAWSSDAAVKGYGRLPDPRMLIASCRRYMDPLPIAEARIGDVLVMKFDQEPQHFAFVSSLLPARVIHAYAAARKVCENGIDGDWRQGVTWQSLIVSAWRFRGID